MKNILYFLLISCFSIASYATGQQTFGSVTLRSPFLNMIKCYGATGSATINPQGVVNPTGVIIQWGTGTNLVTANTITVTNPTSNSYDTTLYVKVTYNTYVLLDTVKLSFVSSAMAADFVNNSDICVEYPNNTYLELACTVTGLGNTTFAPYWSSASNYCLPINGNSSNAGTPLEKTYWVFTPNANIATVTLKNTNGCFASNADTFIFNLKQAAYSPFSNYDTLIKCGGVTISTYINQPPQSNVSFAWGGVYANNGTTTSGLVNSSIVNGSGYHTGSVTVTNNSNNCTNTYTQVYNVTDLTMSIGGTHTLPCDGSELTISDANYNPAFPTYLWSLTGTNYTSSISGVTFGNSYTLKTDQPLTVYSIRTGTIVGETGSGTQVCQVNDTVVFVGGAPPAVTGITATSTGTNSFSFAPVGVSNATVYDWNFGDGNTSNDVNPTHTYSAAGTYTVTLTVSTENESCGEAVTTKSVTVDDNGTSINTINPNEANLKVFPNPATNTINVECDNFQKVLVFDINGRLVLTSDKTALNISNFNTGLYILKVETTKGVVTAKFNKM